MGGFWYSGPLDGGDAPDLQASISHSLRPISSPSRRTLGVGLLTYKDPSWVLGLM